MTPTPKNSKEKANVQYALKSIHFDRVRDPTFLSEMKNEIDLLKRLDHPNVVRAVETFDYKSQIFMVLELCSGGDLHSRDPYNENDACRIICSVLNAVEYMHGRYVTHRDLKYENIMFTSNRPDADVKIIDFGLSEKYGKSDPNSRKGGVGTIFTMAPEAFSGNYEFKSDVWSVGVIAFMLLSSQIPFYAKDKPKVVRKILTCRYRMKEKAWKNVSDAARDFVKSLLKVDPETHPSAIFALQDPWLEFVLQEGATAPEDVLRNIQKSMCKYAGYSTLKKLALMVVSHKSTSKEIGSLGKAFHQFDANRDGFITFEEFEEGLGVDCGYDLEELMEMFHGADLDGTGVLHYTEFLAATIEARGVIGRERLAEAFDRLDSDDSGYISTENLREILGHLPNDLIDEIIEEADLNNDHQISYDEFLAMWEGDGEEDDGGDDGDEMGSGGVKGKVLLNNGNSAIMTESETSAES
uniref:Uncharacterized protein n=1 Tax=Trieres chinensis TaxID=1514140 RepID=A0A6U1ZVH7_TRICV